MLEKYPKEVKIVAKQFPLKSHKFARNAAKAALAAHRQGKFWEFHGKIFENYRSLNAAAIQKIAGELGLDMDTFNGDKDDRAIERMIDRDVSNGIQAGVRGTPTIFINGKILRNRSIQGFRQAIDAELKKDR